MDVPVSVGFVAVCLLDFGIAYAFLMLDSCKGCAIVASKLDWGVRDETRLEG